MIRAVLVGAGSIARAHLASIRALPEVECAAVCDRSEAMAQAAAEEFGVARSYTDYARMLEEVRPDFVHVTTPPASHFALAGAALRAGAHVLVEKPITTTLAELDELAGLARERGRLLVEDQNYLFNGTIRELERRIEDGLLGTVVHVDVVLDLAILEPGSRYVDARFPHPSVALPGGAISDFLTHLCAFVCRFVGPHRSVRSSWTRSDRVPAATAGCDEMRALVEAERGTATIEFSARAQPDLFEVRVRGTKGRATAGLFEPLLAIERVRGGMRPLMPLKNSFAVARSHARCAVKGLWRKFAGRPVALEGLAELVRRAYAAAADGGRSPVDLDHLVAVHRLEHALIEGEQRA